MAPAQQHGRPARHPVDKVHRLAVAPRKSVELVTGPVGLQPYANRTLVVDGPGWNSSPLFLRLLNAWKNNFYVRIKNETNPALNFTTRKSGLAVIGVLKI
jgi:hypothetical protein